MIAAGTPPPASVCLNKQHVPPFSPSAFPASLQTSIVQARNRTAGADMSVIKRSDVKNHLRPPFLTKIHLCQPESQPDATGFSRPEPGTAKATPSGFAADFVVEHSSPSSSLAPADHRTGSIHLQAPPASKSAQA
jgi:hypothetical protein